MYRIPFIILAVFAIMLFLMLGKVVWLTFNCEPKDRDWQAQTEHRLDSMQIQIDSVKTTISVMTE
jgi:hypothetical protein